MRNNKIRLDNHLPQQQINVENPRWVNKTHSKGSEFIVKSKIGRSSIFEKLCKTLGYKAIKELDMLPNYFIIGFEREDPNFIEFICKQFNSSGMVEFCEPFIFHKVYQNGFIFDDNLYPSQWYFKNDSTYRGSAGEDVKLEDAYKFILENDIDLNQGIKVAIVDDGVDTTHPDLPMIKEENCFDFIGYDHIPNPTIGLTHGTYVAGVISALSNNLRGVAGIVLNSEIIHCRAYGNVNYSTPDLMAESIRVATDEGARIINCSWGLEDYKSDIASEIKRAFNKNVLVVCASGNYYTSGDSNILFPGNMPEVLTIGACDYFGRWINLNNNPLSPEEGKKFGSRYGPALDLVAPGLMIPTTQAKYSSAEGGLYTKLFHGTSAASAIVSGIAALLLSIDPDLSMFDLRKALMETADDISDRHSSNSNVGFDHIGAGRVNALKAVQSII